MIVGNLEIRLMADIARLQRDMNAGRQVVSNATAGMERAANAARTALASIGAGLIGGMGLSQIMRMTDEYTKFTAQLKLGTNSQKEYGQAIEDVKRISTSAQNDMATTGVLYARIISSTREMGATQSQVAKITETVNLALAATGAGATESSSAMLQLSQAFGSGVLRGQEFNAVYEAAPELLRILARDIGIPIGQLRKLAEAGELTSDKLVKAFSNDQVINKLRDNVAQITTFSGAMTVFRNNLMEVIGAQLHASGVVATFTSAILAGASAIKTMLDVLAAAAKIGAAYVALFVIAPPLITATAAAMTRLGHALLVYAMNVAIGQTNTIKFNAALFGTTLQADLASGAVSRLSVALNAIFFLFAGWQLGKLANDQFVQVEIAGEVMVGALLTHWERVKFGGKVAFDGLTVFAREAVSTMAGLMGGWFDIVANGLSAIGKTDAAAGVSAYADRIRAATDVQGTFAGRTADARAEMEKNIKVIDLDTDRRSNAALVRRTLVEANERSDERAAAAAAAAVALTKEQIAEAKRQAAAYRDLTRSLQDRVDTTARETAGLAPLTVAEKAHLDLTRQITDGKLKLNSAQEAAARSLINEAGANDVLIKSNVEWAALQQQLADNARDMAQDRYALITSAQAEVEQNELLIETFGTSEDAIIRMNAARLMEQETKRLGRPLVEEEVEDLKRVIELKNRSADAVGKRAEMDASKKAADQAVEDWKRASEDINRSLTDALLRGFESGKGFGKNLVDTIKNMFNTLILRPVISAIVNPVAGAVTGAMGLAGTVQAATGGGSGVGSAVSGLGALGSLTSGVGLLGAGGLGLQAGFGALMSGGFAGVSAAVSGGIAAIGAGTGASIAAGMGTIAGALGPIALGIGGAVMLLNKAFGRGSKEYGDTQTLNGSLGAGGFSGTMDAEWVKKGGWFRSDKKGVDSNPVGAELAGGLASTYDAIKASSADFARALGINADSIASRAQAIKIALGKDEAANQAAIAEFFVGVANTVAGELLPEIGKFQVQGEQASATLERLAVNFSAVDQILVAMGTTSKTAFGAVGTASIEARERLLAFAGSVESLAAQTAFFNENFLSEAERVAIIQKPLQEGLAALGFAGLTTSDQFKEAVQGLVSSGALATEQGAKQYAGLLALGPQFKVVADYMREVGAASEELTGRRRELEIQIMELQGDAMGALAAQRADELAEVDESLRPLYQRIYALRDERTAAEAATAASQAAREAASSLLGGLDSAFSVLQGIAAREKATIQASVDVHTASVAKLQSLSQALRGTLDSIQSPDQKLAARAIGQAQISAALAIARAGGPLPGADSLKDALSAVQQDASDQFSSYTDYLRDLYRTQNDIGALAGLTDAQLSVEEKALQATKGQLAALEAQLASTQALIEAAKGQSTTLLSIDQGIAAVRAAILAAQANPVVAATSAINNAYQTHLGRAPDAAGFEWWKDAAAGGAPISQIVSGIAGSAEADLNKLYQSVLGRAPDAEGLAFWMKAYGPTMDAAEKADFIKAAQPELQGKKIPGFANGGDFGGGVRAVGEVGVEIEATGPSRIHSTQSLMDALRSPPSNNNDALAAAVERLSATVERQNTVIERQGAALEQIQRNTRRQADTLDVVTEGGNGMRVAT